MADDNAPEESGTSEEQDENSIPVDTAEGGLMQEAPEAEDEQEDEEQDMAAELDEAIEMLEALRDDDPENVGAVALVVNTKNGMPREAVEAKGEELPVDATDEDLPDGTTWRVVNDGLEGYGDVNDVIATLAGFNDGLEQAEVVMEQPKGPLGALFGGH